VPASWRSTRGGFSRPADDHELLEKTGKTALESLYYKVMTQDPEPKPFAFSELRGADRGRRRRGGSAAHRADVILPGAACSEASVLKNRR
ncbi:hypothetical protein R0K19_23925, partial [Bacillus sp. SIMBA_161]